MSKQIYGEFYCVRRRSTDPSQTWGQYAIFYTTHNYKDINHEWESHIPEGLVIFPEGKACFLAIDMIFILMNFILMSHVLKKVTYCPDLATGSVARSFGW